MSEINTPAPQLPLEMRRGLSEKALEILDNEEITGRAFLDMTEQKFRDCGLKIGCDPCKEVLAKYGIDGNGIGTIRQFPPKTYPLEDDDEELVQCIKKIKRREAISSGYGFAQNLIQCESALQVNKENRKRKSDEAFGEDFDYIYGIFTTASEWYFILFASDGISSTSKDPLNIRFSESALKEGSEEEKDLRKNVKRVMEVIVGLLKDRLESADEEPDRKRARIEVYRSKK
ncbi:hypothetical protein C1645_820818 [Glomus cerebriforme]|uniref:Uncharacterized protein n=1 Tax=Glomus cerebriforme TaxID=658196 RepID=A0A397T7S3_9GLOM|nr:hypothetical protein C1645_820818 [Glomus cerebriforme]